MSTPRLLLVLAVVLLALGVGAALAKRGRAREVAGQPGLANATLLVIRHAEKPSRGSGLSKAGEARARAYADYFRHFSIDGALVRIDTLIASADSDASARPRLTLEPLAEATGIALQTPFANKQVKDAVRWIEAGQAHGAALIAWHHGKIATLIARLGADPTTLLPGGAWPGDVYDWVIVLRYDGAGRLADSKRIVEPADLAKRG